METQRPPVHPAAPDSHLPEVHSTHSRGVDIATEGQCHGPWKRYQLQVEDGRFILPGTGDDEDGDSKRSALDPATRAGCVPATAYPSFRTMPPAPDAAANRHRVSRARLPDSWREQRSNLSYFHYVSKPPPQPRPKTRDSSVVPVPAKENPRSYPQLLQHYYHGPLNQRKISPRYLVNFGEHGSLLNQPLIAPPTDTHSIQTDEKDLVEPAVVRPRPPSPAKDSERSRVFSGTGRCYHITLILFAVLLVVVAAIALPLWLVPSATDRPRLFYGQTLSFDVVVSLHNRTYNSSLDDPRSPYFRRLEYDFCTQMQMSLDKMFHSCYVQYFSAGSVEVHSRVKLLLELLDAEMRDEGGLMSARSALTYLMTSISRAFSRAGTSTSRTCTAVKSIRIVDPSMPSTVPVSFKGQLSNDGQQLMTLCSETSMEHCPELLKLKYCREVKLLFSRWHEELLQETCDITLHYNTTYGKLELIGNISLLYESLALSARVGFWPATKSGFSAILNAAVKNSDPLSMMKNTLFQLTNVGNTKHANATLMVPDGAANVGCRQGDVRDSTPDWRHLSTLSGRSTNTVTRSFTTPSASSFHRSTPSVPDSSSTVTAYVAASSTSQYRTTTTSSPLPMRSTMSAAMPDTSPQWTSSFTFRPTIPDSTTTSASFLVSKTFTTSRSTTPLPTSDWNLVLTTRRMTPTLSTGSRTTPAIGSDITTTTVSTAMPQTTTSPMLRTTTTSPTTIFTTTTATRTTTQQTGDEENLSMGVAEVVAEIVENSAQMLESSETTTRDWRNTVKDDDGFIDIDDDESTAVDDDVEGSADEYNQTTTKFKTETPTSVTSKHDHECDNVLGKCTVTVSPASIKLAVFSTSSATHTSSSSAKTPTKHATKCDNVLGKCSVTVLPRSTKSTFLSTSPTTRTTSPPLTKSTFFSTSSTSRTISRVMSSIQITDLTTSDDSDLLSTEPDRSSLEHTTSLMLTSSEDRSTQEELTTVSSTNATEIRPSVSSTTTAIVSSTSEWSATETNTTATTTTTTKPTRKYTTEWTGDTEDTDEPETDELGSADDFFTIIIDLDDESSSPTSNDKSETTAMSVGYDTTSDTDVTSPYNTESTTEDDKTIDIDTDEGSATDYDDLQTTTTKATSTKPTTKATTTKTTKTKATSTQATTTKTTMKTTTTTTTPQLTTTPFLTSTTAKTETPTDTTTVQTTTTPTTVTTTQTTTTSRPPISIVTPGGGVPFSMVTPAVRSRTTVRAICPDDLTTETAEGVHLMLPLALQSRCRCHCNTN